MWLEAEEKLLKDRYIGPLIKKYGHCRIKKSPRTKYFTDLVESIISQQLSGKAASTIFNRVRSLCKEVIDPRTILILEEEKLRKAGLSYAKIKYVKDLSKQIAKGELNLNKLDRLSDDEEVIQNLIKVKGIGRWTAEMFLMFSLARTNVFPVDDLGIKKGFEKATGKKPDREKMLSFSQKQWGPHRTAASWYLWRSLEN